jgi:hypothetical protein
VLLLLLLPLLLLLWGQGCCAAGLALLMYLLRCQLLLLLWTQWHCCARLLCLGAMPGLLHAQRLQGLHQQHHTVSLLPCNVHSQVAPSLIGSAIILQVH